MIQRWRIDRQTCKALIVRHSYFGSRARLKYYCLYFESERKQQHLYTGCLVSVTWVLLSHVQVQGHMWRGALLSCARNTRARHRRFLLNIQTHRLPHLTAVHNEYANTCTLYKSNWCKIPASPHSKLPWVEWLEKQTNEYRINKSVNASATCWQRIVFRNFITKNWQWYSWWYVCIKKIDTF